MKKQSIPERIFYFLDFKPAMKMTTISRRMGLRMASVRYGLRELRKKDLIGKCIIRKKTSDKIIVKVYYGVL